MHREPDISSDRIRAAFSAVDAATDPEHLIRFLDDAAAAESGIKHYVAAAHALRRPARPILDLGCGAGHDLALLAAFGMTAVGVDPSAVMMGATVQRAGGARRLLVRAEGEYLPFADAVFSGCRIERVLMHVDEPRLVVTEALRCVETGGLVTVFEPDWSRFEIRSEVLPDVAPWITVARHPDMGAELWGLLEGAGCEVLDRLEELSVWRSLATVERVAGFPRSVERAVALGRLEPETARRWVEEQRRRDAEGSFRAVMPKILVVAMKKAAPSASPVARVP